MIEDKRRWPSETDKDKEEIFNSLPIIYRCEEKYICPSENFWEKRYYSSLFENSQNPDFLKDLCNNYIEGIEWVFKYYIGLNPSWKWKYNIIIHFIKRFTTLYTCI